MWTRAERWIGRRARSRASIAWARSTDQRSTHVSSKPSYNVPDIIMRFSIWTVGSRSKGWNFMHFITMIHAANPERPFKIGGPQINRNGSPLRTHRDRWWSLKYTDQTVTLFRPYKMTSSSSFVLILERFDLIDLSIRIFSWISLL